MEGFTAFDKVNKVKYVKKLNKLNTPLDQLLTEMRKKIKYNSVQITVSALLDSVQMRSSKQSLKHFHTPSTDLFLNCLQLSEAFEWLLGVSKRK